LPALEARFGVHTGEVVAFSVEIDGKVEYRLVGHTANLAAQIEIIAPAGSIAVSDYTAKLCEGYFGPDAHAKVRERAGTLFPVCVRDNDKFLKRLWPAKFRNGSEQ
jgi:class 3 adenylate cyclase